MILLSLKQVAALAGSVPAFRLASAKATVQQGGSDEADCIHCLVTHRDADKTVSELGSNGVAMEVTQPE